ncbi:MAG: rod shape-determining protein MreD [Planctomycetota bacterium]
MRWTVFTIAAWITLGLEWGLRDALQLGDVRIAPSFVFVLVVFISLWARQTAAMGACLILGAVVDLLGQLPTSDGTDVVVLGPHALGYLLAGYTVLTLRALMFRRNIISLAFLVLLTGVLAQILVTFLLGVRTVYDNVLFDQPLVELGQRLGSALYSAVLAIPFGAALNVIRPIFGFEADTRRGFRIQ